MLALRSIMEWRDDVNDDDDDMETDARWPTTMPLTARHSQVVTSHDTEHSLHESFTCHNNVQTSSSHRCGHVVRWQTHRCGTWNASRELAGTSSASQERSVGSSGNRVVTWRPTRMLTGEATEPLDGRSQLESS